jgi:phage terminase small subunit
MAQSNKKLSPKEKVFVAEYLVDCNATAAAIRAGYAESTADKKAPSWVGKSRESSTKPHVWEAIQAELNKSLEKLNITKDSILKELALIGFTDLADFLDWGPDGVTLKPSAALGGRTRAVASIKETRTIVGHDKEAKEDILKITTEFKLHNKVQALTKLGEHKGLFKQVHEHTGHITLDQVLDSLESGEAEAPNE